MMTDDHNMQKKCSPLGEIRGGSRITRHRCDGNGELDEQLWYGPRYLLICCSGSRAIALQYAAVLKQVAGGGASAPSPTGREVSNRCRSWEGLLVPLPAREKGPRVAIKGAKEREEARGGGRGGGGDMCGGRGGSVHYYKKHF